MANHPDADGGPNRDHPLLDRCNQETDERLSAGQLDLQCPEVYDLYVHGYTIGALWILNNPGAAIELMARKVGYTIGFLAHGYFIDDLGAGVDGTRRRVDLIDPANDWLVPVHLGLLIAGLVLLRRRPVALGLVGAPLIALLASALLFYGYVRLGAAYWPVLWIPEATAIAAAARRFASKEPVTPKTVAIVMAVLIALVGVEAIRAGSPRALTLAGAQPSRRQREPRRHRPPAGDQPRGAARARRVLTIAEESHGVARREPPRAARRPRLHAQVEHGLDARHAAVLPAQTHPSSSTSTTSRSG